MAAPNRDFTGSLQDSPLGRSHTPPNRSKHGAYRSCLRLDFGYRCVYCGCHEVEVAPGAAQGGFEVEHFRPRSRKEFRRYASDYQNLHWSCRACNAAKSDGWPSPEEQELGYVLLDPVADSLAEHLAGGDDFELVALTAAGEYFIDTFDLNSQLHRHRRERKASVAGVIQRLERIAERDSRSDIALELSALRRQIEGTPRDAPLTCICNAPGRSMPPYLRLVKSGEVGVS